MVPTTNVAAPVHFKTRDKQLNTNSRANKLSQDSRKLLVVCNL